MIQPMTYCYELNLTMKSVVLVNVRFEWILPFFCHLFVFWISSLSEEQIPFWFHFGNTQLYIYPNLNQNGRKSNSRTPICLCKCDSWNNWNDRCRMLVKYWKQIGKEDEEHMSLLEMQRVFEGNHCQRWVTVQFLSQKKCKNERKRKNNCKSKIGE